MFLLEALVSCVASPFASVARLGPDQHPRSRNASPASPAHGTGLSLPRRLGFMANRRHVRNDTDTLVWPLCLASVVTATGSLPLHFPWPESNVECAQQRVPCWRILIRVGRVCLGTLGHPFSSDGCSFIATFPWKQTVALWYLKSLDTENQRKVKCLTQGHKAWVENRPFLRKTYTHTHHFQIFLSCLLIYKVVLI